jgi:hypothetical protein
VSFAAINLHVASQRVFIVVSIYFFIDSVRKLLDTHSYDALKRRSGSEEPALSQPSLHAVGNGNLEYEIFNNVSRLFSILPERKQFRVHFA